MLLPRSGRAHVILGPTFQMICWASSLVRREPDGQEGVCRLQIVLPYYRIGEVYRSRVVIFLYLSSSELVSSSRYGRSCDAVKLHGESSQTQANHTKVDQPAKIRDEPDDRE